MNYAPASDIQTLQNLAQRIRELASDPVQDERRRLWRAFHDLRPERPMLYLETEMPGHECFGPDMQCRDPFFRQHEAAMRNAIFHGELGDDYVVEPWITQKASYIVPDTGHWGIKSEQIRPDTPGGAWHTVPADGTGNPFQSVLSGDDPRLDLCVES